MTVVHYKTKTLADIVSKVGGLLVVVKIFAIILLNYLLTQKFWGAEAENILSQRSDITDSSE